jgi:Domain of unknown function (DUF397)
MMASSNSVAFGELSWRVAPRCAGGECIQIAASGDKIVIGDSKNPKGPVLAYSHGEWTTFVEAVRQGYFDDVL